VKPLQRISDTVNGKFATISNCHCGILKLETSRMSEWWQSLSDPARIFWAIAIASSMFQGLMFALSLFTSSDFDHSPDGEAGGSIEGVKLLSIRAIVAFLVGFGWTGGLMLGRQAPMIPTIFTALAVGAVFMMAIFLIMRLLMTLRADGTLKYENAIGLTGHVYVTIPPSRGGQGQIEILLQGRLATASAVTNATHALTQNTPIAVKAIENGNVLVVAPLLEQNQ
jgi:hypothetical protein